MRTHTKIKSTINHLLLFLENTFDERIIIHYHRDLLKFMKKYLCYEKLGLIRAVTKYLHRAPDQ